MAVVQSSKEEITEKFQAQLVEELQARITGATPFSMPHGNAGIQIPRDQLLEVAKYLRDHNCKHLSTIVGTHIDDQIELIYPFWVPITSKENRLLAVKTHVPISDPQISSLTPVIPGAELYEREVYDLLGVSFEGHPYLKRLLLAEDHPDDIYPLRRDFTGPELRKLLDERKVGWKTTTKKLDEHADFSIAIGPQHPTHKEPIRFVFAIRGETIEDVSIRLGFNHRGIEKALEARDWIRNLYLIERICGICSNAHQLCYAQCAEQLAGDEITVPDRALWIRVIINELERIHSHMLWYGVLAHDAGYDTMFQLSWRDREEVMDLLEDLTGNRVNYSIITIGGVRRDFNEKQIERIKKVMKNLRKSVQNHIEVLEKEKSFVIRVEGVGTLSRHDAKAFCAVGPTARASGLKEDIRKDDPYAAYAEIPFEIPVFTNGDIFDTLRVRLEETLQSIDIIEYAAGSLPSGPIADPAAGSLAKLKRKIGKGEAISHVEAARGEDMHYIRSIGNAEAPYRHKVRAPTLANLRSLQHRLLNMKVADIPLVVRGIDPCIGCMERVTFVDVESNKVTVMRGAELRHKAILYYQKGKKVIE